MTTTALEVIDTPLPPSVHTSVRSVGLLRPLASPADVVVAQNETRAMVWAALKDGRDYGIVPGTDKPALFKPGAERCTAAFGLTPQFAIVAQEVEHDREVKWVKRKKIWKNEYQNDKRFDWQEEVGLSLGLYRFVVQCQLVHRDTNVVVGECVGICSSMESKYVDRPRDSENTIMKMAQKRAFVGATLIALGLSDEFTQDTEDLAANGVIVPNEQTDVAGADTSSSTRNAPATASEPQPTCPKCEGKVWDNRATKKNPKAPDYKCRDAKCDGVVWPGQWPPKVEEVSDTDGAGVPSTSTGITAETVVPFGPDKGKLVGTVSLAFLRWAVEPDRKLGDHTAAWQEAFALELERRTTDVDEPALPTVDPMYIDDQDLPF